MHRTDADGNVANLFDEGDPGVPRQPTQVDAAILNAFQEELCNLIEAAGITLVKGTNTQLRDAVRLPPSWLAMTPVSPWAANSNTPSYRFEANTKRVFLKGTISATIGSGADWLFWNVPVGYRPLFETLVPAVAWDGSFFKNCVLKLQLAGTPNLELYSVAGADPVNAATYDVHLAGVSWSID